MSVTRQQVKGAIRADAVAASNLNWSSLWAGIGVVWLLIIGYSWTMWIVSGQATPTPAVGAEPWRVLTFRILEVLVVLSAIAMLYFTVYLPKRKTGKISIPGLVVLACATMWYQDPLLNYIAPYGVLSSIFTNWGSWSAFFPGATAPNINLMPEPFPFQFCLYLSAMPGLIFVVLWVMRKWKERDPSAGVLKLYGAGFLAGCVVDLILELPAVYLQVWAYPGAIRWMSLWPGAAHQFPIYEAPMLGIAFAAWASVMFFKNDRGEMFCERGVDRLQIGPRTRTLVRYLAIVGMFQTLYLVTYNIPTWLVTLHQSAWPDSFPAHLTNRICGPGSEVMCPGPGVPYFRGKDGYVINPEGELVRQQ